MSETSTNANQTNFSNNPENTNPLVAPSELPYELPPFGDIKNEHYLPAFDTALLDQKAEIAAIVGNPAEPTWENTVEALEVSGQTLARVSSVFFNLSGTDASDEFNEIAEKIIPVLSAHSDEIYQNEDLYKRIQAVQPPADEESQRLYEHLLRAFKRRGADLNVDQKKLLAEMNQQLSVLSEKFRNNLLEDTQALAVSLPEEQLAGFAQSRKDAAAAYAESIGRQGFVIPLELPTVQSEQAVLEDPAARAALYEASQKRGHANGEVALEMVRLRAQHAELLGYKNHAEYVLEEETAKTPEAVRDLLYGLAPAASANAVGEHKLLTEFAEAESADGDVTGADWPFYEAKVRERDYQLDEAELRKYFPLNQVVEGVFSAANRLYGVVVEKRSDLQGYADGVEVWEVKEDSGEGVGLFLTDYYGRPSKRGGAWMSSFVDQSELLRKKPVIINVMGITKPADGSQALLTMDEVTTVFHEFGHALHGLLSRVRYPSFSGTNVPRDYVEFPSQINENWALDPAILPTYARHVDTGEVIPQQMVDAIHEARQFGQGFATAEYLAASIIDFAWHQLTAEEAAAMTPEQIDSFETDALKEAGLEAQNLKARYQTRYFNHIFGGGYSSGYYSYLWAEALDADGFDWFTEAGAAGPGSSDEDARAAGHKFRELVLSKGGSRDYTAAFTQLRGRDKDLGPLLRRRGLAGAV